MAAERHRGRRSAAPHKTASRAEREIKAAQKERLELQAKVEKATVALAHKIAEWQEEGVGTTEIGTWLVSPEKPKGVTRQQVYKLVAERVDGKKLRDGAAKSNGQPASKARPTRPAKKARPTR